jgi:hypothetical protein
LAEMVSAPLTSLRLVCSMLLRKRLLSRIKRRQRDVYQFQGR